MRIDFSVSLIDSVFDSVDLGEVLLDVTRS